MPRWSGQSFDAKQQFIPAQCDEKIKGFCPVVVTDVLYGSDGGVISLQVERPGKSAPYSSDIIAAFTWESGIRASDENGQNYLGRVTLGFPAICEVDPEADTGSALVLRDTPAPATGEEVEDCYLVNDDHEDAITNSPSFLSPGTITTNSQGRELAFITSSSSTTSAAVTPPDVGTADCACGDCIAAGSVTGCAALTDDAPLNYRITMPTAALIAAFGTYVVLTHAGGSSCTWESDTFTALDLGNGSHNYTWKLVFAGEGVEDATLTLEDET